MVQTPNSQPSGISRGKGTIVHKSQESSAAFLAFELLENVSLSHIHHHVFTFLHDRPHFVYDTVSLKRFKQGEKCIDKILNHTDRPILGTTTIFFRILAKIVFLKGQSVLRIFNPKSVQNTGNPY